MGLIFIGCILFLLWVTFAPNRSLTVKHQKEVLSVDEKRTKPLLEAKESEHKWKGIALSLLFGIVFFSILYFSNRSSERHEHRVLVIDHQGNKVYITEDSCNAMLKTIHPLKIVSWE